MGDIESGEGEGEKEEEINKEEENAGGMRGNVQKSELVRGKRRG